MKPRKSEGGAYESRGSFYARVTIAPQQRRGVLCPWATSIEEAAERGKLLQPMVNDLRQIGGTVALDFIETIRKNGGTDDAGLLADLRATVDVITGGKVERVPVAGKNGPETFKTFGEKWTNGTLHRTFPDDIKYKSSSEASDAPRLARLYKTIGSVPLAEFTLQHAQDAMRKLPAGLEVNTRRHYAQIIHRVLEMAVYPACILKHSPLPRGFVPKPGTLKAKALPWPSEDASGLAYTDWPLDDCMLFGFLPREGMRTGEAFRLAWGDLSLDVGAVRLDENKTDEPRAWALDPSVATALRLWKAMRTDTKPDDLVFAVSPHQFAKRYREYLEKACKARPELLERGANRMRARAHDMRGMFVTYSLANGRNESWVQDRTGHTTSAMLNRYRRSSRTVAELGLGALVPMTSIPEIAAANTAADAAATAKQSRKQANCKGDLFQ